MIASNIKDGEALVELLLSKGADVNAKSACDDLIYIYTSRS